MSKDEHYFDEIDLIYRGSQKRVVIKKKLLKKKNNNNLSVTQLKKLHFFQSIKKMVKFINKNLIKIIFFKFLWLNTDNFHLKSNLKSTLNFKWKLFKKYLNTKLKLIYDKVDCVILIKFIKKYFFKMGKNYILFFLNNKDLIFNLKSKYANDLKYFSQKNENDLNFKSFKVKKEVYSDFMYTYNYILYNKNLQNNYSIYGNLKNFYKRFKLRNKLNVKNLFYKNSIDTLMSAFWVKKKNNNKVNEKEKNLNFFFSKKKRNQKIFKSVKNLYKNELKIVEQLKKKLNNISDAKKKTVNFSKESYLNNDIKIKKVSLKKNNSMKKFSKVRNVVNRVKKVFYKINSYKKLDAIRTEISKLKKIVNKDNLNTNFAYNNLNFLYKINFLKFIYNQKFWIFNIYYYFLSKFLQKMSKTLFSKFLKKIELNIFKINIHAIRADIISKYISSSFKNNYSIYETMRPVLVDLKERMKKKKVAGFKITVSGRFKREQRATYWWRKDGQLLTATQTAGVDYSSSLHKTKYGVCTVNVWLAPGSKGLGALVHEYPKFNPFFFISKTNQLYHFNYFLLKRNEFFFSNIKRKCQKLSYNLEKNYIKGLIMYLLYKYFYINMFLKNILLNNYNYKINKILKRIILPQYCIYKISLENYLEKNYIKIIPFIQVKLLKRINIRNSYKISFLNKSKFLHLNTFKYKISI
jgi:hypothetical protein